MDFLSALASRGVVLVERALEESLVDALRKRADGIYAEIETLTRNQGVEAVTRLLSPEHQYLPQASSLSMSAVFAASLMDSFMGALARGAAGRGIEKIFGGAVWCDRDQTWVRRQYAPHRYPPRHGPHGWHQDGALGFDFLTLGSDEPGPDALLPMVTCWIPLTPCGLGAPGLEFVARRLTELVPLDALADGALRNQWPEEAFWRPTMQAGDAVVFPGGTIHRTHVAGSMRQDRTSVELRFVAEGKIPERLAGDRFDRFL
jgi:Phytanoyl-CoA dioxygenase (PhyH)